MTEATDRQKEILKFISSFIKKNGYSPSFREVGDNFGITLKGASDHLEALKKKGYITYEPRIARSIRIFE